MIDPLARLPGYIMRRATQTLMNELAERLVPVSLRVSEASVLLILAEGASLTSTDIGKMLDIQRANMVPLLARLEAAGFIERRPIDRKSMAIILTSDGEAKASVARGVTDQFEADLMARIPKEHRSHFMPALLSLWKGPSAGY